MASKELTNAAKAIYESRNGARCKPWSQLPQSHQAPYLDDAEAARKSFFAALQEPTEGMLDAKAPWPDHWGDYDKASPMQRSAYQVDRLVARSSWRAMLAASALGEQSE
ncbi:hypothetical protein [Ochrobactrum sp. S1502_03]|uniref:hypothetical protein n=1 Tax=Ochrobactrum sp. S1502_03 TaxID=3108451 RepID=UPI0037C7B0AC